MRFFNTSGPVEAEDHYRIPPLQRVNLGEVLELAGFIRGPARRG